MTRTRRIAATMLAGVLLAGCATGGDGDDEAPPIPQEPDDEAAEEPEEPEDPFAVPDEVDVAYAQTVVDALREINHEAELIAFDAAPAPMPPDEAMARVRAVHSPSMSTGLLTWLTDEVTDEQAAAERLEQREAGEVRWVVTEVGDVDDACLPIAFEYDSPREDAPDEGIAALLVKQDERDPAGHNPTPWVIGWNGPPDVLDHDITSICAAAQELEDDAEDQAEPPHEQEEQDT